MPRVILGPGTWGGTNDWSCEGSPFWRYLEGKGFTPIRFRGFSGDVDGLPFEPFENGTHSDWRAGGWALAYFLRLGSAAAIAHSHFGNLAAYCAAETGVTIPALVTVCTPVRNDMHEVYEQARKHIGHWRHVYSTGWDFWQRAGELFDGSIGWTRMMSAAHDNVGIPNISHSKVLEDPAYFHWWEDAGLLDVLRNAEVAGA